MSDVAGAEATTDTTDATGADAAATAATEKAAAAAATTGDGGQEDASNIIWPDKWREGIAGADDKDGKRLARLGRYDHVGKVFDSMLEIETLYKQADIRSPFPDEGTDEDKGKWREQNSIPAEPVGYFDKLPEGMAVAEEDKAGMETLAQAMHAVNAPVVAMHAAMGAYDAHIKSVLAQRAEDDVALKKHVDDELSQLYGTDFRRNVDDLNAWLGSGGDELRDKIKSSRLPDGTPLTSDPEFLKWMIGQMRELDPLVTVPGLGAGDPVAAIVDEIAKIEQTMQTDFKSYSGDKIMQARYLELITARDKPKN